MKLEIKANAPRAGIPFEYTYLLKGVIHKWIGNDQSLHDQQSFFAFGELRGGKQEGNKIFFTENVKWILSFWDEEVSMRVLGGIMKDPDMMFGMRVQEVRIIPKPQFTNRHRFLTDSPILIRKKLDNGKKEYIYWDNPLSDELLTLSLKRKLEKVGFSGEDLDVQVRFDRQYPHPKIHKIEFKKLEHKASICPVWVHGTPEALNFVWLAGLGDLTGSGFGALRNEHNYKDQ